MSYTHYYEKSGLFHGSLSHIMGTRLDALLFGADQSFLVTTWNKVVAELERLQQMLNKFNPDSELSILSKNAVRNPAGMSDELWNILLDGKKYHELTSGYFDITLSDFQGIEFDNDMHTVCFRGKLLSLDLGGYAKGYAMLKVRKMLVSLGIMQAFINFGNSSVMALGQHPAGKSWLVGIDNPFTPGQVLGSVELCDNSLSTSGNLPHHNQHIVNPRSGEFYTGKKVVSVVADNDLEAEILSTALLLADDDAAEQIKGNFKNLTVYTFRIP
jgi:thiamine biosynthesis lipoprotein